MITTDCFPTTSTIPPAVGTWAGSAWSCTVRLVVTDGRVLRSATQDLLAVLERVDTAASRFRTDSALSRANALAGRPVPVPALLVDLLDAALGAAASTDGAVDPTIGRSLDAAGYDRDIDAVRGCDAEPADAVPGGHWHRVRLHQGLGLVTVPHGTALDLGATAKAWTADHAARTLAARYDAGVLVEIGGDLAIAGHRDDGWRVRVAEREGAQGQVVALTRGGLATSTTTVRTWTQGGSPRHHVLDPATGRPVDGPWRTVSVHAGTALAANVASTAALVKGERALEWLTLRGTAARLVGRDGEVVTTAGWPPLTAPAGTPTTPPATHVTPITSGVRS